MVVVKTQLKVNSFLSFSLTLPYNVDPKKGLLTLLSRPILDLSKLKAHTDNNINVALITHHHTHMFATTRFRIHEPFFRKFFVSFSRFLYIYKHLNITQLLIC